jgi:hypothetical protein
MKRVFLLVLAGLLFAGAAFAADTDPTGGWFAPSPGVYYDANGWQPFQQPMWPMTAAGVTFVGIGVYYFVWDWLIPAIAEKKPARATTLSSDAGTTLSWTPPAPKPASAWAGGTMIVVGVTLTIISFMLPAN